MLFESAVFDYTALLVGYLVEYWPIGLVMMAVFAVWLGSGIVAAIRDRLGS